jgi:large subunit ribosomal protein L10
MRPEKESMARELKERVANADFVILTNYSGMTVEQVRQLRGKLDQANAQMMVLRNRQFGHVARELDLEALGAGLKGPTAMVYGTGDVVETSKILRSMSKGSDIPTIKLGALQGRVITAEDVLQLAQLPPREQLLGMVVGTIAAPMTGLVGVMKQKLSSLVYVLQAAVDKKQNG